MPSTTSADFPDMRERKREEGRGGGGGGKEAETNKNGMEDERKGWIDG